ncbi:GMC family oxidoreductase N-terminal domain-containing protein [Streptomyces sp900116325]|uniref:GMC family oxidoreductase N-terminal domain-containing protein n=1 Tax=Streptomyces sp. 900116325 TaxID=3154295 RepID=UPI0033AD2A50
MSAGRVLGGGGSINYQTWYRGHRSDYDGWVELGMKGWSFEEVLPAFRRSEDHELGASRLHGVGGPIPVTTPKGVREQDAWARGVFPAAHERPGAQASDRPRRMTRRIWRFATRQ